MGCDRKEWYSFNLPFSERLVEWSVPYCAATPHFSVSNPRPRAAEPIASSGLVEREAWIPIGVTLEGASHRL